jgi:threonine/homoserine/homoserine lactone efflux protein
VPAPSTLLLFALTALALIAIPGPNMLYIATRSMSEGRRSGLASATGVLTGTLINVAAAAAGVSAVIASSALAFDTLRYLGAAYLIYLGVRALLRRGEAATATPRGSAYRQAILVQLLNPKTALLFLSLLPQFVDPSRGPVATQMLVLGGIAAALGFAMDCGYALMAGALGARLKSFRRLSGAVYIALGAAAALTGGRR